MTVLRIERPVSRYEGWKRAFDGDPAGRARGGVRGHRVLRPIDSPNDDRPRVRRTPAGGGVPGRCRWV